MRWPRQLTRLLCCITILGLLTAGCGSSKQLEKIRPDGGNTGEPETVFIDLYFSDRDGYLQVEQREVPDNDQLLETTMEELVNGPAEDSELLNTIPDGVKVLGVELRGNVAVADFSREIETNHWGGSLGESITVNSIVDTLCQFEDVEKVEIMIEGERTETLAGHLDLSGPLSANYNMVRE